MDNKLSKTTDFMFNLRWGSANLRFGVTLVGGFYRYLKY